MDEGATPPGARDREAGGDSPAAPREAADLLATLATRLRDRPRRVLRADDDLASAVLVPLVLTGEGPGLLFTRRTGSVARHAGEVSFPGGVRDEGDADAVGTALREAEEEVGIDPASVEVLGLLDDRHTSTGFLITPVVGRIPDPAAFRLNEEEVEAVFVARLDELRAPGRHRVERWERQGRSFDVHYYEHPGGTIWGATARIVHDLLALLA